MLLPQVLRGHIVVVYMRHLGHKMLHVFILYIYCHMEISELCIE